MTVKIILSNSFSDVTEVGKIAQSQLGNCISSLFIVCLFIYAIILLLDKTTGLLDDILNGLTMDIEEKKAKIFRENDINGYLIIYTYSCFRFKRIKINIDSLQEFTALELKEKIQKPLLKLYAQAKYNKTAKKVFKANTTYISTIAEDLKKAIKQCETEKMELIMCSRLNILSDTIDTITEDMENALQLKEYQEKVLDDLKAESYEPFTLTDSMNKLL